MTVVTRTSEVRSEADAARVLRVAALLFSLASTAHVFTSGPMVSAALVLLVVTAILVAALVKTRSLRLFTPFVILGVMMAFVQFAIMYRAGAPSMWGIVIVVAWIFSCIWFARARRYLRE